jgi:hypothetical protein
MVTSYVNEDDLSGKAYITALKNYGKGEPTNADIRALNVEIYSATDRAAAVLLGSLAERAVERLLRRKMRHQGVESLFDFHGPCGAFSDKIQIAYAFELIGPKTKHDLDLIRLLRNEFAHTRMPMRFTTPVVREVCPECLPYF